MRRPKHHAEVEEERKTGDEQVVSLHQSLHVQRQEELQKGLRATQSLQPNINTFPVEVRLCCKLQISRIHQQSEGEKLIFCAVSL